MTGNIIVVILVSRPLPGELCSMHRSSDTIGARRTLGGPVRLRRRTEARSAKAAKPFGVRKPIAQLSEFAGGTIHSGVGLQGTVKPSGGNSGNAANQLVTPKQRASSFLSLFRRQRPGGTSATRRSSINGLWRFPTESHEHSPLCHSASQHDHGRSGALPAKKRRATRVARPRQKFGCLYFGWGTMRR